MEKTIIQKAFEFATEKHSKQLRKASKFPYMLHIYDVAHILYKNNADEKTIIAGILHDTIEDTETNAIEIENLFGIEVLNIVLEETENKTLPYKERKQKKIESLKNSNIQSKMVKCADMLSNLSDIKTDIGLMGEQVWQKFNAPKEVIKWYYSSMIESMSELENIPTLTMYKELKQTFEQIFEPLNHHNITTFQKQA